MKSKKELSVNDVVKIASKFCHNDREERPELSLVHGNGTSIFSTDGRMLMEYEMKNEGSPENHIHWDKNGEIFDLKNFDPNLNRKSKYPFSRKLNTNLEFRHVTPIYSEINLYNQNTDEWINNLLSMGEDVKSSIYKDTINKYATFRFYDNNELGITRIVRTTNTRYGDRSIPSDDKISSFNIKDTSEYLCKEIRANIYAVYQILKSISKLKKDTFSISISPDFTHRKPMLIEATNVKFVLMPLMIN